MFSYFFSIIISELLVFMSTWSVMVLSKWATTVTNKYSPLQAMQSGLPCSLLDKRGLPPAFPCFRQQLWGWHIRALHRIIIYCKIPRFRCKTSKPNRVMARTLHGYSDRKTFSSLQFDDFVLLQVTLTPQYETCVACWLRKFSPRTEIFQTNWR